VPRSSSGDELVAPPPPCADDGLAVPVVFDELPWAWRFRCEVQPGTVQRKPSRSKTVLFRSRGGGDEDANLTTLCVAHHQRCVHAGVIQVSGRAPERLTFEMPTGCFRSGDQRSGAATS
jgi:hypothetical protein